MKVSRPPIINNNISFQVHSDLELFLFNYFAIFNNCDKKLWKQYHLQKFINILKIIFVAVY